jgi:hypothetical protein
MSLINTTMNLSSSGMNTEFIKYIKYVGAFVRPKDMTRYSYKSYLVEKDILGISSGLILI